MRYMLVWMLLLSPVVFDSVRSSQRRIHARQGTIKLLTDFRQRWQGRNWDIVGNLWIIDSGGMLRLRRAGKER